MKRTLHSLGFLKEHSQIGEEVWKLLRVDFEKMQRLSFKEHKNIELVNNRAVDRVVELFKHKISSF